ncbi:MAG: tetratricopeptide repeat protein [Sedimentisphaerales bacterium]|nr:tetratricopeptide repeat protein [Sedimentisphaerales bacterium]
MTGLLEIFGRAITVDASDLIWHWLDERRQRQPDTESSSPQERHLDRIVDLMGEGKADAAEQQLRLYLFEHPSCPHGRLAAAASALRVGSLKEAIEDLNSVYLRQPNHTLALYVLGHCYERLGHQAQAVEFYQDCLKFKGYLQLPAQRLAAVYFKNGRLDDAIAEYELLKQHYPDDIAALVTLGHLYIITAQYAKAIETFNQAILIHPDNFVARDESIDQLLQSGRPEDALDEVDALLAGQPERADLLAKRADILVGMGASTDAIAQYQQAIRICPDYLEATIKLGTAYLRIEAEQLAAQQFNRAIEINDAIVEAYIGLAVAQQCAGHRPEALNTLTLAAAIQPNSSFLFAETAKLILKAALEANLLAAPDAGQALDEIVLIAHQRHLAEFPHNPDLHYRLGILYMNADRHRDAAASFTAALQINPTFARAKTKLVVCLMETGRHDEALDLIRPVGVTDPRTLDLYYRTALLYANRVKFASSVINLQRQIQDNLDLALDPTTNLAIILQNLGLSDTVGLMWENLCQTAAHASAAAD